MTASWAIASTDTTAGLAFVFVGVCEFPEEGPNTQARICLDFHLCTRTGEFLVLSCHQHDEPNGATANTKTLQTKTEIYHIHELANK